MPVEDLSLGTMLADKYRVDALLGEGGMGRVYRAFHVLLERDVALKVLRPEFASNDASRARFVAEARAANVVRHPHVVDVLDVGVDRGVPFIVQELLEGETLARRLELSHRLSISDAIDLLTPIAAALAHAHGRGIVHRDIKPENIFLADSAGMIVPKIVDFGIAQSLREEADQDIVAGTPAYMAPELVLDATARDARSDLWSLGVVLYECLSGQLPFRGNSPREVFTAICTEDPAPLSTFRPEAPAALAQLVHRCLSRDLAARFATARELVSALESVRERLDGDPSSRVRWQSTLAPGTLRTRSAPSALRPAELARTLDEIDERDKPSLPRATPHALPGPSEPPGTTLSHRPTSRGLRGTTVALSVALSAFVIAPLWLTQRRQGEARRTSVPLRVERPRSEAVITGAAPVFARAEPIATDAGVLPVESAAIASSAASHAEPSLGTTVSRTDLSRTSSQAPVAPRAGSQRAPPTNRASARGARDASAPAAPLILLRDER